MARARPPVHEHARIDDEGQESPQPWQDGFELFTASGGMSCNICGCLVRQVPGHAQRHRAWHEALGDQAPRPRWSRPSR